MRYNSLKAGWLFSLMLCALVAACGSGGGGSSSSSTSTPAGDVITGTAAKGLALANARVELRSANTATSATTAADGSYSVNVASIPGPYIIRVCDGIYNSGSCEPIAGTGAPGVWYYSYAEDQGSIANVMPLTDIIMQAWYAGSPNNTGPKYASKAALDVAFSMTPEFVIPTSADINSIQAKVIQMVFFLYPGAYMLDNLLTSSFQVNGSFDHTLDTFGPNFIQNLQDTVTFVAKYPDIFAKYIVRTGIRTNMNIPGQPAVYTSPVMNMEIRIPLNTIKTTVDRAGMAISPTMECPTIESGSDVVNGVFPVPMVADLNSTATGTATDHFYVLSDDVAHHVTGKCAFTATMVDDSVVTFAQTPVVPYNGPGISIDSADFSGDPFFVNWSVPDFVPQFVNAIDGTVVSTTKGTSSGSGQVSYSRNNAAVFLWITGTNGELAELLWHPTLPPMTEGD